MSIDVELPAFAMDCREWWVVSSPEDIDEGQDELDEPPVLAALSTAVVVDEELFHARAVFSLALVESGVEIDPAEHGFQLDLGSCDFETGLGHGRHLALAPNGGLAVIAEITLPTNAPIELVLRYQDLLDSFYWAA